MATLIKSIKITAQGIQETGQSTKRANGFKVTFNKLGAKVTGIYWTVGNL